MLDVAECTAIRFLITPRYKSHDRNKASADTVNDGGVYLRTPEAKVATHLSEEDRKKSKMSQKLLAVPELARRSWNHLAVPAEVKIRARDSAFYFPGESRTKGKSSTPNSAAAGSPQSDEGASVKSRSMHSFLIWK